MNDKFIQYYLLENLNSVRQIKREELLALCEKFIVDNNIHCEETIYQTDRVIKNAYEFIGDICNIVGYATDD